MQPNMKFLKFSTLILLTLSACGQSSSADNTISKTETASRDTMTVYRNISTEFCNCVSSTMRNKQPSTTFDSCYKVVLLKYTDSLKDIGFDPTTQVGQLKLSNEFTGKLYFTCPDTYKLLEKEWAEGNAKKLLFKGELISQTKLPSRLYEIILKDNKTSEIKKFFAKNPLDETQIKKYEPGYELTVEYEIIKNNTTNKDEFFLKEFGTLSGVGAVKVTNQ
jgi:hypothetical protein